MQPHLIGKSSFPFAELEHELVDQACTANTLKDRCLQKEKILEGGSWMNCL